MKFMVIFNNSLSILSKKWPHLGAAIKNLKFILFYDYLRSFYFFACHYFHNINT